MLMTGSTRIGIRGVAAVGALVLLAACSKKENTVDTQTAAGAVVDSSSARTITVADVALGKHIGADKKITETTDAFAPKDSIFASVHTTGTRPVKLTARWTFQDGQVVDERSENLTPSGDAFTEFFITKPSGFPKGKYTLHVLLGDNETQTKDFTVK